MRKALDLINPLRVLIVEHSTDDVELCVRELERAGFTLQINVVQNLEEFSECVRAESYDVVLTDYRLPEWTGLDVLEQMQKAGVDTPLILVTGTLGEEKAVECIKLGVTDFVLKENLARLPLAVQRALEEKNMQRKRARAEEALRAANEKLAIWVEEFQKRTHETALLSEMGGLLQTCNTPEEAYGIILQSAQRIFPSESGSLCILDASLNVVQTVAAWGSTGAAHPSFAPEDCWALRRGRLHAVDDPQTGLLCRHLSGPPPASYLCVPMLAQGEPLGILHLIRALESSQPEAMPIRTGRAEFQMQLAATAGEHMALALANLNLRENLRIQSIRDPLTGLFNRRYMEESLERALHRALREQRPVGLILLDLDRFKSFNDTHGHDAGDTVLRALGELLQNRMRREDIACRYGGEEFLLVLPDAPLEVARQRAELLREMMTHFDIRYGGSALGEVTLSLGVAAFPQHGHSASALLRAADRALYEAKALGRNRVVVSPVPDEERAMGAGQEMEKPRAVGSAMRTP
jgi:diguanylate cyclase (GGDEF)-like protein